MNLYQHITKALQENDHQRVNVLLDHLKDYWHQVLPSVYELTAARLAISHMYDAIFEQNQKELALILLRIQIDKSGRSACTGFCEMLSACVKHGDLSLLQRVLERTDFPSIPNALKSLIDKATVEHLVALSSLSVYDNDVRSEASKIMLSYFDPESLEPILNLFLQEINRQSSKPYYWTWMTDVWNTYSQALSVDQCEDMVSARLLPSMVKNLENMCVEQEFFLRTCLKSVSWDSLVKNGNYAGVGGYETWYFTLKRHDHATWDPYNNEDQPRLLHYLSFINYLTDHHSHVHQVFPNLAAFKGLQRIVQSPQGKAHAPLLAAICERSLMSEGLDLSRCHICDGVCVNPKHKSKRKM